jgi:hypothetical protein
MFLDSHTYVFFPGKYTLYSTVSANYLAILVPVAVVSKRWKSVFADSVEVPVPASTLLHS